MNDIELRPFREDDAESFCRNVLCDPSLSEYLEYDPASGMEGAQAYVTARARLADRPRFYDYAIVHRKSGEVIGEINAAYIAEDRADAGYVIGSAFRRNGYGRQALDLLIGILKQEGIKTIYAACRSDNTPSRKLLQTCGMKETAAVPEQVQRIEETSGLVWFVLQIEE